jgi:Spy/CpxP family protein refolding chaperone
MKRRMGRVALCAGMLLVSLPIFAQAPPPAAQTPPASPRPRFAWWRDENTQKQLGLTTDQVTKLEAIFQAALPDLRKGRDDLDRHEAELSRLIETDAEEAVVVHQIDKVESIRGRLDKTRQLVLLHHRQVLTPDQRVKLKALFDQARANRGRAGAPPNGQRQ